MKKFEFRPIGIIHTPFKEQKGTPIQAIGGQGYKGRIELEYEFIPCLKDLEGFSHIILLYQFHLSEGYSPEVIPYMDNINHGVFATRAPSRPNPIGISIVKLTKIEGRTLFIEELDMIDGTPLLDIKPYVPKMDERNADRFGWLENNIDKVKNKKADDRFV